MSFFNYMEYKYKVLEAGGLKAYRKQYQREYYLKHKEKMKEYNQKYYIEHQDEIKAYRKKYRENKD